MDSNPRYRGRRPASSGVDVSTVTSTTQLLGSVGLMCIPPFVPAAGGLLVEPDRRQILIDVVARADLPALYVRPIRDDPVVPGRHQHMRLGIEHVFFEFTHQG